MLETVFFIWNILLPKVFENIVAGNLSHFWKVTVCFPSQFSYMRVLKTCDALLKMSHHLQDALDRDMERFAQLDFSAAFDRVSQRGLLFRLRPIGVK